MEIVYVFNFLIIKVYNFFRIWYLLGYFYQVYIWTEKRRPNNMKSLEAREMFNLSREDMRRLENMGVLVPQKYGQGIAADYDEKCLLRLLDIKFLLLAGFRLSEMEEIMADDYDSDELINDQILEYKKRILMLEFINKVRRELIDSNNISGRQITETQNQIWKNAGIELYTINPSALCWDVIRLVFIFDYLSRKKNYDEEDTIIKKEYDAYLTLKRMIYLFAKDEKDEVNNFIKDLFNELIDVFGNIDDEEIKQLVKDIINEYGNNKEKLITKFKNEIGPIYDGIEKSIIEVYSSFAIKLFEFICAYFIGENELYYLIKNFTRFLNSIDKKRLKHGEISVV